jgi:hypothetical protein
MLIKAQINFSKSKKPKSFVKFDFYTFKGIKNTIQNRHKIKQYTKVFSKKQAKDKVLTKLEERLTLFDKNYVKIYYNLYNPTKLIVYKFFLNFIVHNNILLFKSFTETNILGAPTSFIIK